MKLFETLVEQTLKDAGIDITDILGDKSLRMINKLARGMKGDDRATERAIRWYSRVYFPANGPVTNLEYALGLDTKIGDIVNGR